MLTIIFGSNQLVNTNGILTFVDTSKNVQKELFKVELRDDLQPMITVGILNEQYHTIGKAYRSYSFVGIADDYEEVITRAGSDIIKMVLRKKDDKSEVFEMIYKGTKRISLYGRVVDNTVVEINGVFRIKNYPNTITATKNFLTIGTNTLSQNTKVNENADESKGIVLTPTSIGF
jgi:hypothetical protein